MRGPNHIARAIDKRLTPVDLDREEWAVCVDRVSQLVGRATPPIVALTLFYDVCVESLITPLSWQLAKLNQRVWSKAADSSEEYLNSPCIREDAEDVITSELNEINRVKAKAQENERKALEKKMGR